MSRNSQRKGGKLDDKLSGPNVIDKIMDLGIARLRTLKGKVLKKMSQENSYRNTIKKTMRGITQIHVVKQKMKINQEKEDDYHRMLKVARVMLM